MPSKVKYHSKSEKTTNSDQLPRNWPDDVLFLTDHTFSTAVAPDLRVALSKSTNEGSPYSKVPTETLKSPCPWVEIQIISDEKHPAYGQRGLFAFQHLEPDGFICLYLGHVHTNSLSDTNAYSDYDLSLDRDIGLSVDAAKSGNESRFANDYRRIADRPNAEFRDCLVLVKSEKRADGVKWERRVGIFVLSAGKAGKRKAGIKAREEILVSYGKGFWESRKAMATFRKDFEMRECNPGMLRRMLFAESRSSGAVQVADAALGP